MRSFGERVMVMAEGTRKKQKQTKKSGCVAICPEKYLWMVCCKQKSINYTV